MLNISRDKVDQYINRSRFKSNKLIRTKVTKNLFMRVLLAICLIGIFLLFLPWTQNIQSKGYVTTIYPDQRPQTINSVIAGKVQHWKVKEGDYVEAGDTIIIISEVKPEYFDPLLLQRTDEQVQNKLNSVDAYENKIAALEQQMAAFRDIRDLKMKQAKNKLLQSRLKVKADSIDLVAYEAQYAIALKQYHRMKELYDQGIKSLTDLEIRNVKLQEMNAKMISQENKLLSSRNEVINAEVEIISVQNEYSEKLAKTQSEQQSAWSSKFEAEAMASKLKNQYSNYAIRQGMYTITASRDGYVTKLVQAGIGDIIKDGDEIVTLMPANTKLAVEFYVDPIDYPLVKKGEEVRIQFDGWPAIFFSGWPNTSYGTYAGEIYAMDNFISPNGKYRILVKPKSGQHPWPDAIRVGGGVRTFVLLNDVPVWYELWRKLNGFPPDFYHGAESKIKTKPEAGK